MYELEGKIEPVVQIKAEIVGTGPRGQTGPPGIQGPPGPAGKDAIPYDDTKLKDDISALKSDLDNKLTKPETAQVGQIFKVQSINEDGSLVLQAVDMPSGGGAVDDVQINGESVVVGGVANIPIASTDTRGVVTITSDRGIGVTPYGTLSIETSWNGDINNRTNMFRPITPYVLDHAVKAAMCDGKGAEWSAEEQAAARERMGIVTLTKEEYNLMKSEGTLNASTIYLTYDGGSKV